MKRDVRIKLDFVVTIDDERDGLPYLDATRFVDNVAHLIPGVAEVHGAAKIDVRFTPASWKAYRAMWKKAKRLV
jgi:hypothetical protein